MSLQDTVIATQARIEALESRLDELQAFDEGEAERLNELQEECECLRQEFEDSESGAAGLARKLDTLESQLEAFGVPKDFVEQPAAAQAEVQKRPIPRRGRAWYRQRPRTFGLVVLGAVVGLAVVAAGVGLAGLNQRGRLLQALAHGIGVLFAARLIYVGASRWADPSLGVVTTTYAHGRTASGEHVSIANGVKERFHKPRSAALIAGLGLLIWLLVGGAGTAVTRGWILGPSNFRSDPSVGTSPANVGRVRSR